MLSLRYKTILSVALPLMGSSFIQSVVLLTDSSFLSRYSTLDFIASGNAGLIYITLFMVVIGFSDGAQILFARRIGQNRIDALGKIFGSSIVSIASIVLMLFIAVQLLMPQIIHSYSAHQDVASAQVTYISIRSYALWFGMISLPINAFYLGRGKTKVVLLGSLITALTNIILDYTLIFGHWGMPAWGLKGAAWASTIADGLGMVFLVGYLMVSGDEKQYQLFAHFRSKWDSIREIFKISLPIVGQGFIALSTWTVFFIWIEQMGKFELTVSQNIRAIYFLAFVPLWGFAGTTKTYISQYLGAKKHDDLRTIQRRIQFMTVLFMVVFFHGGILYPETLIGWINPEEAFIPKSAEVLRYISFSMFIFGFVSVYFQTINGSGNTLVTFIIEIIAVAVYLISAFTFIKLLHWDIKWVWTVEYIYFGTLGLLSLGYLRLFDWKKKEV